MTALSRCSCTQTWGLGGVTGLPAEAAKRREPRWAASPKRGCAPRSPICSTVRLQTLPMGLWSSRPLRTLKGQAACATHVHQCEPPVGAEGPGQPPDGRGHSDTASRAPLQPRKARPALPPALDATTARSWAPTGMGAWHSWGPCSPVTPVSWSHLTFLAPTWPGTQPTAHAGARWATSCRGVFA